jgi:hypothetical protein
MTRVQRTLIKIKHLLYLKLNKNLYLLFLKLKKKKELNVYKFFLGFL